ncbi:MAG: YfhO family protein [Candidatus Azobacteroides pseudotrichonymphae]|jgi:hypothetical protein|nr:MAG: YfhO family protein [Candidatus Azobacteroides pseudotrichonymphae]
MYSVIKKSLAHIVATSVFLILISVYFAPSIFQKKTIQQADMQKAAGMATDVEEYYKKEGGISAWSGMMFSGMPSYQTRFYNNFPNYLNYLEKPIKAIDYTGASMILTALICFYILMCIMDIKHWLAIAGAIAFSFASYNFIIIAVGHITKMYVIAFMPLTIGGIKLLFRKNWLWGIVVFTLGICLSVVNGHIQITYYLFLFCIFLFVGLVVDKFRKKEYLFSVKASGMIVLAIVFAILPSMGSLYINYEASQESTRGQSNLITVKDKEENRRQSPGLDIDYAFSWSYGRSELLTLLIPRAYGGSSIETLDKNSQFYKTYKALGGKLGTTVKAPTYWGNQPFTAGPVYFGAIVCFLFVLGMCVIENPIKWWIASASLFFIFLSLGKNFMLLNEFLFYHLPMYSKFRTPAMALVIPGMTFPLIGFWGLSQILNEKADSKQIKKSLIKSFSVIGGICLLIWIMPTVFLGFNSPTDEQFLSKYPQLIDALIADRCSLASNDALRSFVFILLTSILIFFFLQSKNKKAGLAIVSIGILVLITIDMWGIDRHYLNYKSFASQKLAESYKKTASDEFILRDTSLSYRVLNISRDTFNETNTSFFHKSIGGYHAAKLKRYQELIDHRIINEINTIYSVFQTATSFDELQNVFKNTPTLNMLNAKYIIYHPDKEPLINLQANGNAWFVSKFVFVDNANQEMKALNNINPQQTAIINKDFTKSIKIKNIVPDSTSFIQLVEYKPNYLKYISSTTFDQLAIFSEIYYKNGWKSFIDQKPVEHFRADWALRAMCLPAGRHIVEFRFEPDKYNLFAQISSIASLIILLGFVGILIFQLGKSFRFAMIKK